MKIAMIGQKGLPANFGGVERHVHDMSIGLAERGFDVHAYCRRWYAQKSGDNFNGVNLIFTPTLKSKHFDAILHTLTSSIHALFAGFDVIHYHGVGPSLLSWIPRLFAPRVRVVTTFHSIDRHHQKWGLFARVMLRLGEWTACRFAHKTIAVSQSIKHYCQTEYDRQTVYIPNGVALCENEIANDKLPQFGLEKEKYMVMVSRLVPHKGAHLLIEAFNRLKSEHARDLTIKNLKLAIVGGSVYTDDYVASLHKAAGKSNDIVFTDFQSGETLAQLYTNAICLVHPSLNEGLPITVLEAMRYHRPALVSDIPEHLELIQDDRAIYRENDIESLAFCLFHFLRLSSHEQQYMADKNLETVKNRYSWQVVIPQIIRVYQAKGQTQKRTLKAASV